MTPVLRILKGLACQGIHVCSMYTVCVCTHVYCTCVLYVYCVCVLYVYCVCVLYVYCVCVLYVYCVCALCILCVCALMCTVRVCSMYTVCVCTHVYCTCVDIIHHVKISSLQTLHYSLSFSSGEHFFMHSDNNGYQVPHLTYWLYIFIAGYW